MEKDRKYTVYLKSTFFRRTLTQPDHRVHCRLRGPSREFPVGTGVVTYFECQTTPSPRLRPGSGERMVVYFTDGVESRVLDQLLSTYISLVEKKEGSG